MIKIPDNLSPYPITFTVFDTDNTTKKSGASCFIRNITKKTSSIIKATNASGVAIIDLANMEEPILGQNQYDDGDKILIIAFDGSISHEASAHTVNIKIGAKDQTLYLAEIQFRNLPADGSKLVSKITHILTANTTGTNYFCKIYKLETGERIAWIETLSKESESIPYPVGLYTGPFVVERENNGLIVTVTIR